MGRYVLTRRVAAPPERVFAAWCDPLAMADWMDAEAVLDATGPLDVVGTTFTLVIFGPWRFQMQVARSEAPVAHEFGGRAPLGGAATMSLRLTPAAGGGTDLEVTTAYTVPLGPIGRWLDRRFIAKPPRAGANRELDRFVAIAEGAAVD